AVAAHAFDYPGELVAVTQRLPHGAIGRTLRQPRRTQLCMLQRTHLRRVQAEQFLAPGIGGDEPSVQRELRQGHGLVKGAPSIFQLRSSSSVADGGEWHAAGSNRRQANDPATRTRGYPACIDRGLTKYKP